MPIYEYKCRNCDHIFEQLQKINDEPLLICPKCNEKELVKLISSTSFQLKGSGWYVTDFKEKNSKKEQRKNKTENTIKETKESKKEQATPTPTEKKDPPVKTNKNKDTDTTNK